ncbi:MAG TPA: hypothetical protein PKA13_17865 [Geminicoccaceae bacterium]|nr:hypothetical protein [Geminicoccus sp.]HMU51647.1 hypothetical protein [Geminicoccaceae bacterium]
MTMSSRARKFALSTHVAFSVGLLGAIAGFLALAVAGLMSQDAKTMSAAYIAMDLTARFVIVPLGFASLLTGLVQSLGTAWGLFRHYWVLVKLLVTVVAVAILLLQMASIGYMASAAAARALSSGDLFETRISLVAHAGGGLVVLLVPLALSVYKPRGRTRYGTRKEREQLVPAQP